MDGAVEELLAARNKTPFDSNLVKFGNSLLVPLQPLDDSNVRNSLPDICK